MIQEFVPTHLYIKTHNQTGLKYFGKTIANDPHNYKGSGKHWKRHIKKHGNDVSTEIVGLFTDKIWIQFYALEFSEANNIIESDDWANLIPENGVGGGGASHFTKESRDRGMKTRKENKTGFYDSNSQEKSLKTRKENKTGFYDPIFQAQLALYQKENKIGLHDPKNRNKSHSQEARQKQRDTIARNGSKCGDKHAQFGKMWITNGVDNTRIKKEELVPEGWYKGRVMTKKCATIQT